MTTTNKPNVLFWIIAVISLIWNGLGAFQYLGYATMKDEMLAVMPEARQAVMTALPTWYTAVFAVAVWFAVLASILLLARKKWAVPLFLISLLAVVVQMVYWLFGTNAMEAFGSTAPIMPVVVIILALVFYLYSKSAKAKGWLR